MLGARGCLGAKFFYTAKIYASHIAEENNTTPNSRQVLFPYKNVVVMIRADLSIQRHMVQRLLSSL